MNKKISDAEKLLSDKQKTENITEAIKIYNHICLSPITDNEDKFAAIKSLYSFLPEEANEIITRWRDMIPFSFGKQLDSLTSLLSKISSSSFFGAHERTIIAVCFYNHARLDICFKCFESIALDGGVSPDYRAEACRYLYGNENSENREMSQECLMDIVEDLSLKSEYRYKIINDFISKKGVSSYLNASKIKVPYDEEFVYGLQMAFFHQKENGIRERILSGQHLLQMACITTDEKQEVQNEIMSIVKNTTLEENIRADAADVLMRVADAKTSLEARQLLVDMGHSAVNMKNTNFMDKVKTLYNNSQNVHEESISTAVNKFIEKLVSRGVRLIPFADAQKEVVALVKSKKFESKKNFTIYGSLNRISMDTAIFSSKKATLAEIFVHVWIRIKEYDGEIRKTLEDRLIDELLDMGDTCSSGHSGRFVNVLSRVDPELDISITFEAQITANIAGRINARIRDIKEENIKSSVSMGMLPNASQEDISIYREFITKALEDIKEEMYKEFVGGKYISDVEFSQHFTASAKEWLSGCVFF